MTKAKQKKVKKTIPELAKENGQTIRTIFQIIKVLLKLEDDEEMKCSQCGSTDLVTEELIPDEAWYEKHIRGKSRNKSSTDVVQILNLNASLLSRKGNAMSQTTRNVENL
jgi:hypothetical protein